MGVIMECKSCVAFSGLDCLFEKALGWLFATKTRVFEVFNASLFMTWAIAIMSNPALFEDRAYQGLDGLSAPVTAAIFAVMATLSLVGIFSAHINARFLGGYSLFLSALVWAVVSVGLFSAYPPLSAIMVLYPQLSLLCFVVGRKMINESSQAQT